MLNEATSDGNGRVAHLVDGRLRTGLAVIARPILKCLSLFEPEVEAAVAAYEPALDTELGSVEQLEYAKLVTYLQALDAKLAA